MPTELMCLPFCLLPLIRAWALVCTRPYLHAPSLCQPAAYTYTVWPGTNAPQVVCRIPSLLGIFRGGHGTYELSLPPVLDSSTAFYDGILWLHRPDARFRAQGKKYEDDHGSLLILRVAS